MYELNAEKKIVTILDAQSGEQIGFIIKVIKSDDQIKYRSETVDILTKKKNPADLYDLKTRWGEKIILGIQNEYFSVDGKPISTEKEKENYYAGWFTLLKENRIDLVWKVVDYAFGEMNVVVKEEQLPFVKSSNS